MKFAASRRAELPMYLSILRADARRTEEIATVTVGLLVTLEAKPGKEAELAAFVASALPLAQAEPDTTAWFAIKVDASTFGIVDVSRTQRCAGLISMAQSPLR